MFLLLALLTLQEGVRLPGSPIRGQEEIRQGEGVIERLSRSGEGAARIWVFNLNDPCGPHCLDREPSGAAGFPVIVPGRGCVGDQCPKLGEDVGLDGRKMYRTPLRRLLSWLNPFHRKLRSGDDKKPVELIPPPRVNRPDRKPAKRD